MRLFMSLIMLLFSTSVVASEIKSIKFAMEATYPPFEYIDAAGQMQGFDVDLAKALCQELQATCTFSNQAFNSLIPSLQLKKFDAIISALGITPQRLTQVAFTQSYYQPSGSFIAASAKHYQLTDLAGKTIGVQIGSTFEKYLQEKYGSQVKQKSYASIQEAFLDLIAERVDVVLADTPIAQAWLQNHQAKFALIGTPIVDEKYFGSGYGIAVRKNDVALLNALNQALTTLKANGTYTKIVNKYFHS